MKKKEKEEEEEEAAAWTPLGFVANGSERATDNIPIPPQRTEAAPLTRDCHRETPRNWTHTEISRRQLWIITPGFLFNLQQRRSCNTIQEFASKQTDAIKTQHTLAFRSSMRKAKSRLAENRQGQIKGGREDSAASRLTLTQRKRVKSSSRHNVDTSPTVDHSSCTRDVLINDFYLSELKQFPLFFFSSPCPISFSVSDLFKANGDICVDITVKPSLSLSPSPPLLLHLFHSLLLLCAEVSAWRGVVCAADGERDHLSMVKRQNPRLLSVLSTLYLSRFPEYGMRSAAVTAPDQYDLGHVKHQLLQVLLVSF
ncbi:hypothetical protein JOB18_034117 [Solea senegalensis]|uniref:Uncharacterized protein n=1 Tax=Solea senegalensis TaxID=28829 RepID=A0AAV6S1X7_SOLSE|nr:hypothetical protein JOB18_034117 [Solea senegalensis]